MKPGIILTTIMVLTAGLCQAADPVVSNVQAAQRPDTPYVDITYDLADADTETLDVTVAISTNGGVTYNIPSTDALSGQVGSVARGSGRAVVWNAGATLPPKLFSNVCARVTADEPPLYMSIDLSGGTAATTYPVTYYATSNAVPGGVNSDAYKTTNLLMRLIPAGVFTMGSPVVELGRYKDETQYRETQHQVNLTKDFYIGVFEITQRQWELVMGNRPSYFNDATYYASRPVDQVSYYDIRENPDNSDDPAVNWPINSAVNATSFMGKLRTKTGLTTFDLPTEAQWEYACRAGTTTALNSGKNLTNTASDANMDEVGRYWYNNGSTLATAKVGSYLPNAWGLYDMHGNVWEWCLDWYNTYSGPVSDPLGAAFGSYRVLRGGSWSRPAYICRSAGRNDYYDGQPDRRLDCNILSSIGFRAARTLP